MLLEQISACLKKNDKDSLTIIKNYLVSLKTQKVVFERDNYKEILACETIKTSLFLEVLSVAETLFPQNPWLAFNLIPHSSTLAVLECSFNRHLLLATDGMHTAQLSMLLLALSTFHFDWNDYSLVLQKNIITSIDNCISVMDVRSLTLSVRALQNFNGWTALGVSIQEKVFLAVQTVFAAPVAKRLKDITFILNALQAYGYTWDSFSPNLQENMVSAMRKKLSAEKPRFVILLIETLDCINFYPNTRQECTLIQELENLAMKHWGEVVGLANSFQGLDPWKTPDSLWNLQSKLWDFTNLRLIEAEMKSIDCKQCITSEQFQSVQNTTISSTAQASHSSKLVFFKEQPPLEQPPPLEQTSKKLNPFASEFVLTTAGP